ncbi:MAG: hypothetical protein BWY56_02014 [Acidobacteria bacterium ADurb.Bin340]|nr:MAG: hypothetical protein BWY56_02014 [Acidobacteria bacterium ADurb.Bin340]HOD32274.1 hypothetical protein [Holophaga sp.]HQL49063.1 hypothetical protein [Holophaga sp.]
MAHDEHVHGPDCNHEDDHEIEVVELEDENGEKEEFAILDEVDFEDRHFCIMAPLAEVQAFSEQGEDAEDGQLSIEIFEVQGDNFSIVDDEDLAKRLLAHIDQISEDLEDEKD